MNRNIDLTQAEWSVMECLWESAPRSGREVTEALAAREGWSRSTTLTLLKRLEDKGAVESRESEGKKVFSPLLARTDAAERETKDFLSRVYHGSVKLMVSALTEKKALSQSDIDELYEMLRDLEGGKK